MRVRLSVQLTMIAEPLEKGLAEDIELGKVRARNACARVYGVAWACSACAFVASGRASALGTHARTHTARTHARTHTAHTHAPVR